VRVAKDLQARNSAKNTRQSKLPFVWHKKKLVKSYSLRIDSILDFGGSFHDGIAQFQEALFTQA